MKLLREDRERLIRYLGFLEAELADFPDFEKVDWKQYQAERNTRRSLERWIENIVNCSIDIAKVLLVAEGRSLPATYREILRGVGSISPFDEEFGNGLARWASLRNIITHEYLDVSWPQIQKFLKSSVPTFARLAQEVRKLLQTQPIAPDLLTGP